MITFVFDATNLVIFLFFLIFHQRLFPYIVGLFSGRIFCVLSHKALINLIKTIG